MACRTTSRRAARCSPSSSLAVVATLLSLAWRVMAPGGWTAWEVAAFACFAGTAPWTALCAANAILGFAVLMAAPDPAAAVLPALRRVRAAGGGGVPRLSTAIAVCIRDERMEEVLPPLGRLLDGLAARGAAGRFTLWLLSDTTDPALAAGEEAAVAAFRAGAARSPPSASAIGVAPRTPASRPAT